MTLTVCLPAAVDDRVSAVNVVDVADAADVVDVADVATVADVADVAIVVDVAIVTDVAWVAVDPLASKWVHLACTSMET